MILLTGKWAAGLAAKPETGMGYQVVSIRLKDGQKFDQVVVVQGQISGIRGRKDIPFSEDQIAEIEVTHDKWDFNREPS